MCAGKKIVAISREPHFVLLKFVLWDLIFFFLTQIDMTKHYAGSSTSHVLYSDKTKEQQKKKNINRNRFSSDTKNVDLLMSSRLSTGEFKIDTF